MELIDGRDDLDRRARIGEMCIDEAAGYGVPENDPDREAFAADAISHILTAMFGPAGAFFDDGTGYRLYKNDGAYGDAEALLDRALNSYDGDSEDYEIRPPKAT